MSLALISTSGVFTTNIVEGDKAETIAPIVSGVALSATGTSIDFTGIPNWVKRITVMFSGVSTNGSSIPLIRIGAGAVQATGYLGARSVITGAVATSNHSTGFGITADGQWGATSTAHGSWTLNKVTGNTWSVSGTGGSSTNTDMYVMGGAVTLGGVLDRVRITTVNGTDSYDAGTINIMWE